MNPLLKLLLGSAAAYGLIKILKPVYSNWGSTVDERNEPAPGSEIFESATVTSTMAITIDAPPSRVWPWLVQMGVGRGGFYSYSWLENLVGCKVKNADRIIPELQNLKLGDKIFLHPKAPPLEVICFEPERALALEGWRFELKPLAGHKTRLISRTVSFPDPKFKGLSGKIMEAVLMSVFFDLAHFIMERKQLREIKRLCAHSSDASSPVGLPA